MNEDKSFKLSPSQINFISGGLGGCCGKTFTAPLARLTILYQVSPLLSRRKAASIQSSSNILEINTADSLLCTIRKVINKEGILSLWKGNLTAVVHRFPYSAINFAVYESSKNMLTGYHNGPHEVRHESPGVRFVCGALAGAVACAICYPLDIVRTRLTVGSTFGETNSHRTTKKGSNIMRIVRDIVSKDGYLGLYQGLSISLLVTVPTLAIGFLVYGQMKEWILSESLVKTFPNNRTIANVSSMMHRNKHISLGGEEIDKNKLTPVGSLLSGCVSGLISSVVIFPADVIRKRMQVAALAETTEKLPNPLQHCKAVLLQDGMRGFYRGIVPELLKVCPMVAVTFCTYEMSRSVLYDKYS